MGWLSTKVPYLGGFLNGLWSLCDAYVAFVLIAFQSIVLVETKPQWILQDKQAIVCVLKNYNHLMVHIIIAGWRYEVNMVFNRGQIQRKLQCTSLR